MEKLDENSTQEFPSDNEATKKNFHTQKTSTLLHQNLYYFPSSKIYPLNPGNISNLHRKVRELSPEWVEGLSLRLAKNLSVSSGVYAEWMMGNQIPVGARFGCAFGFKDKKNNITKSPMLTVDTNPNSLASNFHFLYHPFPQIKIESKFQTLPYPRIAEIKNSTVVFEMYDKQATVSLNFYNPKPNNGQVTLGILYSFTKEFCGGVEILSDWNELKNNIVLAFAGRYTFSKKYSLATTISKNAFDISLWHQPKDFLQLGASLIYDHYKSKSIGSLCYQMDFDDAKVNGMIDSDFSVGCTYTAFLRNLSSTFGFSLLFCIPTQKFYCGLKYELNSNFQ